MLFKKYLQPTARIAFWLAVLVTLWSTLSPSVPAPPGNDKIQHFVMFAILTALFWLSSPDTSVARRSFFLLGFAALIEILQGILPIGRTADPVDWLADAAGVLSATIVIWGYSKVRPSNAA